MKLGKKFIVIALLTVVVLAGSIGGIALANTGEEDDGQTQPPVGAFLEKVCEIYNAANPDATINAEELQKAMTQARTETMTEFRSQLRQRLIDEGRVTQEQLDDFDAWMESMPEDPFHFGPGHIGGIRPFDGFGRHGGGFPRFGGPCTPQPAE